MTDRNDYDSPWKEILSTYFQEFMELTIVNHYEGQSPTRRISPCGGQAPTGRTQGRARDR